MRPKSSLPRRAPSPWTTSTSKTYATAAARSATRRTTPSLPRPGSGSPPAAPHTFPPPRRGRLDMTTHLDPTAVNTRLELLLDEGEIKNCVLRYCHGTARLNWQMVADCSPPSASDDHGSFQGGPAELA